MENQQASDLAKGLNSEQIQQIIKKKYNFAKVERTDSSPSQDYELEDGYRFGIIEPHKDDFCATCNRVRLTASGVLIPCLYFEDALSIKEAIKETNAIACVTGAGSMFRIHMKKESPKNFREAYMSLEENAKLKILLDHLYNEGFVMINTCSAALSTAMTENEIDALVSSVKCGLRLLK